MAGGAFGSAVAVLATDVSGPQLGYRAAYFKGGAAKAQLVKQGRGILAAVRIWDVGGGAPGIRIFDGANAGGRLVYSWTNVGGDARWWGPVEIGFAAGLYVMTLGTNAPTMTVIYV